MTKKTKLLFLGLSLLFVVHGIEEYITGFYNVDKLFQQVFWFINDMTVPQASFLVFQIFFWLILLVINIFLFFPKSNFMIYFFLVIIIFELYHPLKSLMSWSYYPGLLTSLIFPVLAYSIYKNIKE